VAAVFNLSKCVPSPDEKIQEPCTFWVHCTSNLTNEIVLRLLGVTVHSDTDEPDPFGHVRPSKNAHISHVNHSNLFSKLVVHRRPNLSTNSSNFVVNLSFVVISDSSDHFRFCVLVFVAFPAVALPSPI
jgi:hypothetical protein